MLYFSKRQAFLVNQGYAFKVITRLKDMEKMPDLAFDNPQARRELLQRVIMEVESKSWKEEEAKEAAGLLADGNMFYGPDGKPLRKGVRRTAGVLEGLSGGQDMAYVERNKSANRSIKAKGADRNKFFKSIARENERRRKNL